MITKNLKKFLKWKWIRTSNHFLLFLFIFQLSFSQSCAYNVSLDESNKLCAALGKKSFISNTDADKTLDMILSTIGASKRFIIRECSSVNNASATTYKGVRYIFYNDDFIEAIVNRTDNWSNLSILAHEVGHHINGHTLEVLLYTSDVVKETSLTQSRIQELEADEFSGFVMAKLGATKKQALNVMKLIASDDDDSDSTHPSRKKRIAAITKGYLKGSSQFKTSTVKKDKVVYKTDTIYINPKKNFEDYFYEGVEKYYKNDMSGALSSFSRSLNNNKNFIPSINNIGLVYNEIKEYDKSIEYFNKALKLDPKRIGSIKNRAIAFYNKNDYLNAISDCNEAIMYSKNDYELFKIRGSSYLNLDEVESAEDDFEYYLKFNQDDSTTIYQLGILSGMKDNFKKSIQYFSKAIKLSPNQSYFFNRAISFIKIGDNLNAIKDLEYVISKNKNNISAVELLANQYMKVSEFEKACEYFQIAEKLGSTTAKENIINNCGAFQALEKINSNRIDIS